ncbi:unnamed protein product [Cyprideis torosa]|uniref:Uncharacterized protein n=1 Tax=Cyprideis torosa TaxID=163714 RepID=A0A7R8W4J0_9CRUS|nr:unnamed protein product [Cyprideis torosa]CAG0884268.1 unnamed protein product [Cyprideis torosa]
MSAGLIQSTESTIICLLRTCVGSTAERLTMLNAARCCDNARRYFNLPKDIVEDVELDLVDVEKLEIGEPFKVTVIATNRSSATRTIKILMSSSSIYYNGSRGKHILKTSGKFAVRSGHRETVSMKVDPREYLDKLVDYGMIKIYALATVEETKQTWSEEDDFQIEKPRLQIKFREPAVVDKNLLVTFSFTNPLDVALTKCKFSFEGPGLKRPIITRHRDVPPRGSVSHVERFIPRRAGQKRFVATFSSVELIDVRGSATVTVHTSSL